MEKIGEHGFVRLVETMPVHEDPPGEGELTSLDRAVVQAARVSYAGGTKTTRGDRGLIRYLLRHAHTTPFEMIEFKFHFKMPMFVARQHLRHRTASVNELSARYSIMPEEFFVPDVLREQSSTNKQGSEGDFDTPEANKCLTEQKESCENAFRIYGDMIRLGVSRELARAHLPVGTFTEFYWKINLHNLMHYLRLRMETGAQKEIRDYAWAMYRLVQPLCPVSMEAFTDFKVNAITFSGPELGALAKIIRLGTPFSDGPKMTIEQLETLGVFGVDEHDVNNLLLPTTPPLSKAEQREMKEKLKKMGLQ